MCVDAVDSILYTAPPFLHFYVSFPVCSPSLLPDGLYKNVLSFVVYRSRCTGLDSSLHEVMRCCALNSLLGPAEKPTLTMAAYLVENQQSTPNPKCTTASLGYNPDYIYSWVVKRNNGTEVEQLPVDRSVNSIK